ncbi:diaminopimelate epimerase [Mesobacillus maritimus]|uniref:Diaminopimelate epimerase n=1 Tax=Mesobacillus maritimus TaxID=1643336 RepID=A0ABS7K3N8_9BACI|nr:diaminopimelate epimerase [Mesobacillus maritimus]MBY0096725.1 diaminopimelate epimerase [Mesobacillus maritimus]
MMIELIKCHGSGNDFLLIDEMDRDYGFTEESRADLAKSLCNRETELGADGILFILSSTKADARMRVFNSDGSEASMCGNGLRCAARYICEKLGVTEAIVETMKANLQVKKETDIFPGVPTYNVEISPVSFRLEDLPLKLDQEELIQQKIPSLSNDLVFTALAVPNPHLVAIVNNDQVESNMQKELSEKVNGPNEWFPDGVNVSFIKLLEKGKIYVRTFERGVGFTNACGTAMSSSSLVTCLIGENQFEEKISVYNNGGMVQCVVHKEGDRYTIDLIGNATYMYKATVDAISQKVTDKHNYSEQEAYHHLREHAQTVLDAK